MARELRIETSVGAAAAVVEVPRSARALIVLGHGAGGGVDAADLLALRRALPAAGYGVAAVTQPYRLAGRRAPAPARTLDAAWSEVVAALTKRRRRLPIVLGGRSSGARVACRTQGALGAAGVLALAFPLHPPGHPEKSRAEELSSVDSPALVLHGERDPFGSPAEFAALQLPANIELRCLPAANHGFGVPKSVQPAVKTIPAIVLDWLDRIID